MSAVFCLTLSAAVLDDDAMSVTSQEVAEILSTAAPMAPFSDEDDYEEPPEPETDDDVSGDECEKRTIARQQMHCVLNFHYLKYQLNCNVFSIPRSHIGLAV